MSDSLHKKSCPYFLNIWKIDLIFSSYQKPFFFIIIKHIWSFTNQKPIFSSSQKQIWYFFKSKDFILCNKHRSEFLSTKTIFSTYYKTNLVFFNKPKSFFFNHQNRSEFFLNKEKDTFINKFVWFSLFHLCNISFIACIKGVHRSQESRKLDST